MPTTAASAKCHQIISLQVTNHFNRLGFKCIVGFNSSTFLWQTRAAVCFTFAHGDHCKVLQKGGGEKQPRVQRERLLQVEDRKCILLQDVPACIKLQAARSQNVNALRFLGSAAASCAWCFWCFVFRSSEAPTRVSCPVCFVSEARSGPASQSMQRHVWRRGGFGTSRQLLIACFACQAQFCLAARASWLRYCQIGAL